MADPQTIANAIMEQSNGLVAVDEVRFDPITDSLVIRARGGEDAQQGAWQAAQAVAPLFAELDAYAPIVDLKVDDVRCACSTPLMKEIAARARRPQRLGEHLRLVVPRASSHAFHIGETPRKQTCRSVPLEPRPSGPQTSRSRRGWTPATPPGC